MHQTKHFKDFAKKKSNLVKTLYLALCMLDPLSTAGREKCSATCSFVCLLRLKSENLAYASTILLNRVMKMKVDI